MADTDSTQPPEPRRLRIEDMSPEQRAYHEKLVTDEGMRMFGEFLNLKDSPRQMIVVGHGFLELMINAVIDATLKNAKKITSDSRGYPHSAKLLILNELGILGDDFYAQLDWFRKLRNRAAHQPLFSVTKADLQSLPEHWRDPSRLGDVLELIVCAFWNQHTEILRAAFMPTLEEQAKRETDRKREHGPAESRL